jgi:hypothetical protein
VTIAAITTICGRERNTRRIQGVRLAPYPCCRPLSAKAVIRSPGQRTGGSIGGR